MTESTTKIGHTSPRFERESELVSTVSLPALVVHQVLASAAAKTDSFTQKKAISNYFGDNSAFSFLVAAGSVAGGGSA